MNGSALPCRLLSPKDFSAIDQKQQKKTDDKNDNDNANYAE